MIRGESLAYVGVLVRTINMLQTSLIVPEVLHTLSSFYLAKPVCIVVHAVSL